MSKRIPKLAGVGRLLPALLLMVGAGALLVPNLPADADPGAARPARAQAAPAGALEVYPPKIELSTREDGQAVVVRARRGDGVTEDLTRKAKLSIADPSIASVKHGVLRPGSDGETQLIVEHNKQRVTIPVTVKHATKTRPISFRLDVLPVFAKAGCNNGSCHGSARGQDGFNLSLFGFDPVGDHKRITTEQPGRRINLADTEASMLLTKSIGAVPHTGGKLFGKDHAFYHTLKGWLDAGAPDDPKDVAIVTGIQVFPQDIVLEGTGDQQQITVRAQYSDGSDRDVTDLAVLMTSNETSAKIGNDGVIKAGNRGEAFVMARFDAYTVGTPVIVVPRGSAKGYPDKLSKANYIDDHINAKLKKMRIVPAGLADDATFARRVHLDIIGQLPSIETLDAFVADNDGSKRAKLVDRLLEDGAFADIWAMKWAERLQITSSNNNNGISQKSAVLYYEWLRDQLVEDRPMNDVVFDLIAAGGGTFENPATNFYEVERNTLKLSENVVQNFIGARMQCAQCHNHPFDRWTMDDYYGFTAFFTQIGRKNAEDPRERVIFNRNSGEVKHPLDGREMQPTFLGGGTANIPKNTDRREVLASWLTSTQNQPFNRNLANFVWEHFLGRGITHPIDDVRISNPPVNPELLDALGDRLVQTDYDIKQLIRDITASHAYQRSTRANDTNATDTTNFSRAHPRRIRAEVLLDCITQVTRTEDDFRGLPPGARAVQIIDGNTSTYFLTTFGRSSRETVCSCEVVMEPNLSQALHLINGSTTNNKIRSGRLVRNLLEAGKTPDQVVEHLYLAALSRKPSEAELSRVMKLVESGEKQNEALEDVFWALLNSKEFIFNH
ncbi:MAG: DUF1549 and DUF1553 domain-containing protein [Phycisphaeraceae bacterium]|nr:DUF1549 and DUF1553 domain-containing protein [Phycisphaeraceae bacterium]